jgi:protoporphyrinogen oxidase
MSDILILGAGLAGLSVSYHAGHEHCTILEKNDHAFGHISTEKINGFTWDEGPHVSFTSNEYVKELFKDSVGNQLLEYEVKVANYFNGSWIDHPAQSNLYQVSEPLRSECIKSYMETQSATNEDPKLPDNYAQWLEYSFGEVFAKNFPFLYTRKYWTIDPEKLGIDWVGTRVFQPKREEILKGSLGPLGKETHYIKEVRYPLTGGYQQFANKLAEGARIELNKEVVKVDLQKKEVTTRDGKIYPYKKLVNTLPLPIFVGLCVQAVSEMKEAATRLSCSQILIVNITAPHTTRRPENWIYVYDEDMLSTRINFTERLSPKNAPEGFTGVQVEVYASKFKPFTKKPDEIGQQVLEEVIKMGLIDCDVKQEVEVILKEVPWANVIFTNETTDLLNAIWKGFEEWGLNREFDDTHPLTDWQLKNSKTNNFGSLIMAGRFGQWKYYWTDDCVLRGEIIGRYMNSYSAGKQI